MSAKSVSFVQYKYCSLCRTSCKKWRKHVHSPRHQEIVKNILTKFQRKICDAKSHIEQPRIKDANWADAERQVWCYSCACDVDLHLPKTTVVGDCIIVSAGFLGHVTRKDHSENTAKFLKDNLVDMKRTSEFALENDVFLRFLEKAEKVAVDYLNEKREESKKAANAMRLESALHRHVMNQGLLEQKRHQLSKNRVSAVDEKSVHNHLKTSRLNQEEGERKKTAQAFGDGLTVVERSNEDDSQGNIHSNAIPPWLQPDGREETNKDGFIGPSIIDWAKHKKLEEKKKLPACRVGAKFDHTTDQGDEWLPSFGGVWSHGPRTKSSSHFKRRFDSKPQTLIKQKEHQNARTHNSLGIETSSLSPSSATAVSQSHVHLSSTSEAWSRLQQPAENKDSYGMRFDSPTVSNFQSQSSTKSSCPGNENDDRFSFTSSSLYSTKTVKPYLSKRRKVGESSSTNGSMLIPSTTLQASYHYLQKETSSSPALNHHYSPPTASFTKGHKTHEVSSNQNDRANSSSSSFRLLHTPVLNKKS